MKTYLLIAFWAMILVPSIAQPISGFYFGSNLTFINSVNKSIPVYTEDSSSPTNYDYQETFTPRLGWQLGYTKSLRLKAPINLTLGANVTQKSVHYTSALNDEDQEAFYLCMPLAINYNFGKFYSGLGYEFGYNPEIIGTLNLQEFSHAALIQAGYHFWFFDLLAKYAITLNRPVAKTYISNDDSTPVNTPINSTFQLSLVIGSPALKNKKIE